MVAGVVYFHHAAIKKKGCALIRPLPCIFSFFADLPVTNHAYKKSPKYQGNTSTILLFKNTHQTDYRSIVDFLKIFKVLEITCFRQLWPPAKVHPTTTKFWNIFSLKVLNSPYKISPLSVSHDNSSIFKNFLKIDFLPSIFGP